MTQATDAELWRSASSGEAAEFGTLFERHANAVYNFCFRRTADWSLAEDMTSIVFLEAWRRRSDVILTGESARPWLLGVATNVIRHRRRAQRRHRAALERLPRETEPDFVGEAEARLDDERQMRAALALLGKLPRREQDVFALCAWADLTYEETAAALGIPVGTVRSRLSRARARVRRLLEEREWREDGPVPAGEV
jgi:RNA polymerase sigma factor (sigma-70 family)